MKQIINSKRAGKTYEYLKQLAKEIVRTDKQDGTIVVRTKGDKESIETIMKSFGEVFNKVTVEVMIPRNANDDITPEWKMSNDSQYWTKETYWKILPWPPTYKS